jgi:hypothetical protein
VFGRIVTWPRQVSLLGPAALTAADGRGPRLGRLRAEAGAVGVAALRVLESVL